MEKTKTRRPDPRIPRERGVTQMAMYYQKTQDPNILKSLQNYLIKTYLLNSFSLNKTPLSLPTLAQFLNVSITQLNLKLQESFSSSVSNLINPNKLQESFHNLISLTLNWAIEDRAKALNQYQILQSSQGLKYQPFISSETTKSIELLMKSNNQINQTINSLIPKVSNTLILNNNENKDQKEDPFISTHEALELIQSQSSYIPLPKNPIHQQQIYKELIEPISLNISESPEDIHNAYTNTIDNNDTQLTTQDNTNKIALGASSGAENSRFFRISGKPSGSTATPPVNIIAPVSGSSKHQRRRAAQLGINEDTHIG